MVGVGQQGLFYKVHFSNALVNVNKYQVWFLTAHDTRNLTYWNLDCEVNFSWWKNIVALLKNRNQYIHRHLTSNKAMQFSTMIFSLSLTSCNYWTNGFFRIFGTNLSIIMQMNLHACTAHALQIVNTVSILNLILWLNKLYIAYMCQF